MREQKEKTAFRFCCPHDPVKIQAADQSPVGVPIFRYQQFTAEFEVNYFPILKPQFVSSIIFPSLGSNLRFGKRNRSSWRSPLGQVD